MRCQPAYFVWLLALGVQACVVNPGTKATGGQTGEGGGQIVSCLSEAWSGPNEPRRKARCQMPLGSRTVVRCTCDVEVCRVDARGDPDPTCAIDVDIADSRCDVALASTCDAPTPQVGFCEVSGLAAESRATCWTQADGSHLCQCPGRAPLVPSPQTDCALALYSACASDCESQAGRCEHVRPEDGVVDGLSQYRCSCERGVAGMSPAYFCEDALRRHCSPECEDERGACWKIPDATGLVNTADCLCKGSSSFVHLREGQWDEQGEACRAPLAKVCGE